MSRFDEFLQKKELSIEKIKKVYLSCSADWMVGYSGGKDSSVLVQIILESLISMKQSGIEFKNKIYFVSSDTLIENPIVLEQLNNSLSILEDYVSRNELPVIIKKVKPDIEESFWVNLIGRGYPLPNQTFRWCTDRLKIKPMSDYTRQIKIENKNKEVITVLGVRKGESSSRDIKLEKSSIEDSLFRSNNTGESKIFSPIEDFQLYDIWNYLGRGESFFSQNNIKLSILYEDSSLVNKECPSTLDDAAIKIGCGNSRWGCWICPVVTQDKSLLGFINSGSSWLKPLLDFRDQLMLERDDRANRYKGSLRINKKNNTAIIIPYRFMKISKSEDGLYFIPKKYNRPRIDLGLEKKGKLVDPITKKTNQIHSEYDYIEMVKSDEFDQFSNSDEILVIRRPTDEDNLYTVGLGPYTVEYRKEILKRLMKLNNSKEIKDRVELISEEEVIKIKKLIKVVEKTIDRYKEVKNG